MTLYFEQNDQENISGRRINRVQAAAALGENRDVQTSFAAFAPMGYELPPLQPPAPRIAQRASALIGGDDADMNDQQIEITPFRDGWQVALFQPPTPRFTLRYAGLLNADANDQNDRSPLIIQFARGWEIQTVQPPAPWRQRTPLMGAAALARGDDGNQFILIPPWLQALGASTFPDYQNRAAGAIPSWNAGPPAGAVNSMPYIGAPTSLKLNPGNLLTINVVVAGSAPGGIYDVVGNNPSLFNQVGVIPNTVDGKPIVYDWPCQQGILIVPGPGQIVSAKWV